MRNKIYINIFISFIVFASINSAYGETITNAENIAYLIKKFIPSKKLSCAVEKIENLVSPKSYNGSDINVGEKNAGINFLYQTKLDENPCFANLAYAFWRDPENNKSGSRRPSINDSAGSGDYKNVEPGFVWKKALKFTNNNKSLALNLLGICATDDDDFKKSFMVSINYKSENEHLIKLYNDQISEVSKSMQKMEWTSDDYHYSELVLKSLKAELKVIQNKEVKNKKEKLGCPNKQANIYLQKSIVSSFDLPKDLKNKIIKIQRPNGNADALASKSYHFVGGALEGCELAKCGLTPDEAGAIARNIAMVYRGIRLCPIVKELISLRDQISEEQEVNDRDPSFHKKTIEKLKEKLKDNPQFSFWLSEEEKILFLKNKQIQMDAATLYSKWYLGGPDSLIPCTSIRGGPDDLNEKDFTQDKAPHQSPSMSLSECNIIGWSAERCAAARQKLSTWDVDFEWTQKQHEIGAKFGAEQCKDFEAEEKSAKAVCDASAESAVSPAKTKMGSQ